MDECSGTLGSQHPEEGNDQKKKKTHRKSFVIIRMQTGLIVILLTLVIFPPLKLAKRLRESVSTFDVR